MCSEPKPLREVEELDDVELGRLLELLEVPEGDSAVGRGNEAVDDAVIEVEAVRHPGGFQLLDETNGIVEQRIELLAEEFDCLAEAATLGVKDDIYGEVPVAFVSLRPGRSAGEPDLLEHCRARLVAFKVPAAVVTVNRAASAET